MPGGAAKVQGLSFVCFIGKTAQITATEIKKDRPIKHHRNICYENSNTKVATVTPDVLFGSHELKELKTLFLSTGKELYWDMFEDIRSRFNIHNKDIPMKYFIDSFCICLAIFGKDGYRKCCSLHLYEKLAFVV